MSLIDHCETDLANPDQYHFEDDRPYDFYFGHPCYQCKQEFLNQYEFTGWNPLLRAAARNYGKLTTTLIQAGAAVNPRVLKSYKAVPAGATPLWITVQITHNVALATFLIQAGGELEPNTLDATGRAIWKTAKEFAKPRKQQLFAVLSATQLPKELTDIVTVYMGPPTICRPPRPVDKPSCLAM